MEIKKNPNVDLDKKKPLFFQVGLVISLVVFCAAFDASVSEREEISTMKEEVITEADMMEITKQPEELPKSQKELPKQTVKVMSDVLKIVEDNAKIETDIYFADDDPDLVVQTVDYGPGATGTGVLEDDTPFLTVEDMPQFQGKKDQEALLAFRKWVFANIKYPQMAQEANIQGRVVLTFVVERDGSVTVTDVLQSPDPLLTTEAKRVISKSPKWTPGKQRGTPVRVRYNLPVDFRISQ